MTKTTSRRKLIFLTLLCTVAISGCTNTRGAIYLHSEKVNVYLAREKKPELSSKKAKKVESALVQARDVLKKVPDANRILGGFCTKPSVIAKIRKIQDLAPKCRLKLKALQDTSNTHGIISWSILGGTAATGVAMVLGGLFAPDDAKVPVAVVFGSIMLVSALTNGFGPFSRWYETYRVRATKIDNYMWTLRKRIGSEVCIAPSLEVANISAQKIVKEFKDICTSKLEDDGTYRPGDE